MENSASPGPVADEQGAFMSLLAGRHATVAPPSATQRKRCFTIRAAESHRERRSASNLVGRMYATRGYQCPQPMEIEQPAQKTFVASDHNAPIGTLSIRLDSCDGLLAEGLFRDEVSQIRSDGLRVCEFTKLAMERHARSPRLLAALFHVAYIYAHRINGLQRLLIEVNPRHVRYYQTMLDFKVIGAQRHNTRVNAPAVLLSLDLAHARAQIGRFGGKPQLAASERSAYPYFFSPVDEAGIIGRLHGADNDIAHVFESHPPTDAALHVDGSLH